MKRICASAVAILRAHASPEIIEALNRSGVFEAAKETPPKPNNTAKWARIVRAANARLARLRQ